MGQARTQKCPIEDLRLLISLEACDPSTNGSFKLNFQRLYKGNLLFFLEI